MKKSKILSELRKHCSECCPLNPNMFCSECRIGRIINAVAQEDESKPKRKMTESQLANLMKSSKRRGIKDVQED